jgi:hypothetical protein
MGLWIERLDKVRNAIDEILLNGQSVALGGRTLQMADLEGLRNLEKEYEQRASHELQTDSGARPARSRVIYVTPTE